MKKFAKYGALLGAMAVSIGAFGAHAFKNYLIQHHKTETFDTATKYLFYHAIILVVLGYLPVNAWFQRASLCFLIGSLVFSGSLFAICATLLNIFGAIAPVGGLLLVAGWICVFIGVKNDN